MPAAMDIPATETAIVQMTNAFRAEHKLGRVTPNPLLEAAAQAYAKVLAARKGELSHSIDGTTPATRIKAAGYAYCQIGENLAVAYDSSGFSALGYARLTLNGWIGSPGHLRNLLLPEVTDIGVAVARAGSYDPRYVAVQVFARPRALSYTFTIANRTTSTVPYTFAGEARKALPHQIIGHTSCAAGDIVFQLDARSGVGRYEARDGRVYTLRSNPDGGVKVDVSRVGANP